MARKASGPGNLGPKERPKMPGLVGGILSIILFLCLVSTGMFVARWNPSGESAAKTASEPEGSLELTIGGGSDEPDVWQRSGRRDYIRCDMVELRQNVRDIWEAIDELDEEIDRFQNVYKDVWKSNLYPELLADEFALKYFADEIKDPLPKVETPDDCAELINVLMRTVNRALANERAAYNIEYSTRMKIESIGGEVNKTLETYRLHREFVEALRALTAAGELPEPENMKEAVHKYRLQRALERMGYPDALREEYRAKPNAGQTKIKGTSDVGPIIDRVTGMSGDD